jgi:hypothetical protein
MNWLAIVLGAVAFFAVGAIWYTVLFGKVWQRLVGLTDEQIGSGANMPMIFGLCFLLELLVVTMLGHLLAFLQPPDHVKMMISTGFGLTIMSPAIGIVYLYMRKPLKLFLIDAGHFVVGMAAVGAVFVLLG